MSTKNTYEQKDSVADVSNTLMPITPYRQQGREIEVVPAKQQVGFILSPNNIIPLTHRCKLPQPTAFNWCKRQLSKLFNFKSNTVPKLRFGDLWRCKCGKVYLFRRFNPHHRLLDNMNIDTSNIKNCGHGSYPCSVFCDYWVAADVSCWVKAGGTK